MRTLRAVLVLVLLGLLLAAPASASSPPGPEYDAPDITRTCQNPSFNDLRRPWRTTFNGHRVDLFCGDRLLVGEDGRCWFEIAGAVSPARCLEP